LVKRLSLTFKVPSIEVKALKFTRWSFSLYVGGGQNSHSKGGEKRPILGKLRTNNSVHFNLLSIRFV